jgi:hypothetical protein
MIRVYSPIGYIDTDLVAMCILAILFTNVMKATTTAWRNYNYSDFRASPGSEE